MGTNIFYRITIGLVLYIFSLARTEFRKLRFTARPTPNVLPGSEPETIPLHDQVSDFIEVFKTTRVFFLFNLTAFIIFIFLPQGKDVVLMIIEDLSSFNIGPLFSLLLGVTGWAVFAEFGARYKIYITDNSGKALTGSRVNYRKQVQRFLSMMYLLLPFVVVFLSVVIITAGSSVKFIDVHGWHWDVLLPYSVVLICILLVASGIAMFYLDRKWRKNFGRRGTWFSKNLILPPHELRWLGKLYGIYNDYVFSIRKETYFNDKDPVLKEAYTKFINHINPSHPAKGFPEDYILSYERPPESFKPKYHSNEYYPVFDAGKYHYRENRGGTYRWVYTNTPSFYKVLHNQVRLIFITSLIFLVFVSLVSPTWIGSPGLVCLSFGCWQGLYTGLLFVDYRYRKSFYISVRWVVFAWLLLASFLNNDHPLRYNTEGKQNEMRPTLTGHFKGWMDNYERDTTNILLYTDSSKADMRYPVIFITAEGGALRTGAFTALFLATLQDSFPQFKKNIYAFSTVSGGSVGVSFFNAISYLGEDTNRVKQDTLYFQNKTKAFFSNDQLSTVLSRMFYADILNYLWPWQIKQFDRAIALEKEWESNYQKIFNNDGDRNIYSTDFLSCYGRDSSVPAWYINTTEVETGLQCYVTNVRPDKFQFNRERDLLSAKIRGGINYSTAVNMSARFPLVSPSAAVEQNSKQVYHYVDGGYVENTGAKTMCELLQTLSEDMKARKVKPYVIQLKFGGEGKFQNTGFLNEINSIFSGIYNTRSGNSRSYTDRLKELTDSLKGEFISVPLEASTAEIPMSWVLSERSLGHLDDALAGILLDKRNELHGKLFLYGDDSVVKNRRRR